MGCGCSGSNQARQVPPPRRQASPSQVPGGPGQVGYTWDGPKKTKASPTKSAKK